MISPRTTADISIKRLVQGVDTVILTVPITSQSMRRFKLMESNSIELKFSSYQAVPIKVGDFIIDEVFGRFYAKESQVGVYNTNTGGYDYTLTFVSHEMLWGNFNFLLATNKVNGTPSRKEVSWNLTGNLLDHLKQIRQNLIAMNLYTDVVICMGNDIAKASECHHLTYNGVKIYNALNSICEDYGCEWWVDFRKRGVSLTAFRWNGNIYARYPNGDTLGKVSSGSASTWQFYAFKNASGGLIYNLSANLTDGTKPWTDVVNGVRSEIGVSVVPTVYNRDPDNDDDDEGYAYTSEDGDTIFFWNENAKAGDVPHVGGEDIDQPISITYKESTISNTDTLCLYVGKFEDWKDANAIALEEGVATWQHAGKDAIVFKEGENVEKMQINRNQSTYANRMYVFGGTRNVPSSYRKSIKYKVTVDKSKSGSTYNYSHVCYDANHQVTPRMIRPLPEVSNSLYVTGNDSLAKGVYALAFAFATDAYIKCNDTLNFKVNFHTTGSLATITWRETFTLSLKRSLTVDSQDDKVIWSESREQTILPWTTDDISRDESVTFNINGLVSVLAASYNLVLEVKLENIQHGSTTASLECHYPLKFNVEPIATMTKRHCHIDFGGNDHLVCLYPMCNEENPDTSDYYSFIFINASGTEVSPPSGWGVGKEFRFKYDYEIEDGYGLDITKVPLSWFEGDYDNPFSLLTLGDQRLMLPVASYPNGYAPNESVSSMVLVKEDAVIFNDIYPRCTLKVTEVIPNNAKMEIEYTDGSSKKVGFSEYLIKVKQVGGSSFPFKSRYQVEGTALNMAFVGESEMTEDEKYYLQKDAKISKLNGMTFECNYQDEGFLLIINNTYGAELPNDVLCPEVGDVCVLVNWDVRALSSLNIIESAESALAAKATEYLDAIEEDQFTFSCQMMSEDMLREELFDSANEQMVEDDFIYVKGNPSSGYTLPMGGEKIEVKSGTLNGGSKTSRIIGYEFKLDIPYDSPTYTVGETDAYSRLKKIEKEITKI